MLLECKARVVVCLTYTAISSLCLLLGAVVLGRINHVGECRLSLLPGTGLQSTVGVDPELLRLEVLKHLLDAGLDLLLAGDTRRVDVVDTRSNVARVGLIDEDLEELGVRLAVLDTEDISVKSGNGVEEVLELGVAEVGVDLSRVLDTTDRQLERVDGPLEVVVALLTFAKGKTLTQGRLIDLDNVDTSSLKVNNLVTKSESKLLSLDGLVNIITRERPPQTSDRSSKHTLHGLLGDRGSVLGLLDSHGSRARDVTNDDWWSDAARTV